MPVLRSKAELVKFGVLVLILLLLLLHCFYGSGLTNMNKVRNGGNLIKSFNYDYVWISMGLCHSMNTAFKNKGRFPYKEAAILSTKLWLLLPFDKPIRVHVYLTHTSNDDTVTDYIQRLRAAGAVVTPIVTTEEMCVLIAQTSRMFAYGIPEIGESDIIITSDVDAFPTSTKLLKPLKGQTPINIWLYSYARVGSVPMCFISMDKYNWEQVMDCEKSIENCVLPYRQRISSEFGLDQCIITHQLLLTKSCFFDFKNRQDYSVLGLTREPFDDSDTCGHYEFTNSHDLDDSHFWTHFYPHDTNETLYFRYNGILKKNNILISV